MVVTDKKMRLEQGLDGAFQDAELTAHEVDGLYSSATELQVEVVALSQELQQDVQSAMNECEMQLKEAQSEVQELQQQLVTCLDCYATRVKQLEDEKAALLEEDGGASVTNERNEVYKL